MKLGVKSNGSENPIKRKLKKIPSKERRIIFDYIKIFLRDCVNFEYFYIPDTP